MGFVPTVYFSNDNIDTEEEYLRRSSALIELCRYFNSEYIIEDYLHDKYLDCVVGLEDEPEKGLRCKKCIEFRLSNTALKSRELGIKKFTTTLPISPHKDFKIISQIGEELAQQNSLEYLSINFRKQDGFLKTNAIANSLNLYRQNYCGCEFAKSHLK